MSDKDFNKKASEREIRQKSGDFRDVRTDSIELYGVKSTDAPPPPKKKKEEKKDK